MHERVGIVIRWPRGISATGVFRDVNNHSCACVQKNKGRAMGVPPPLSAERNKFLK